MAEDQGPFRRGLTDSRSELLIDTPLHATSQRDSRYNTSGQQSQISSNLSQAQQLREADARERRAQLTQWDLRMLLFTRIVSLGYLFTLCVNKVGQWTLNISFSITLLLLAAYSCYLTIRLRGIHDNKIQYYQHMAYAQGMGRSSILLISLLLSIDYGIRLSPYYVMARQALQAVICRVGFEDENSWFSGHSW